MNPEQSNQENVTTTTDNYVDPRTIEAEVIGELRKEKIGKPMLVIEMFALLVIVLVALPIVFSLLQKEGSFLHKLVYGSNNVTTPADSQVPDKPGSNIVDGSVENSLGADLEMRVDNIVLKNFIVKKDYIECTIYSYSGVVNLDETDYYLEIYSNSKAKLTALKLTGKYDYQEKDVKLYPGDFKFNESIAYYGKIVKMEDKDYPIVHISSDESGIGSLICQKDNRTLEYIFKNNYLIGIKDSEKIIAANLKENEYANVLKEYNKKAEELTGMANVLENETGFEYSANINLEQEGFKLPKVDYNYYELDTEAKILKYAIVGKGFDCK